MDRDYYYDLFAYGPSQVADNPAKQQRSDRSGHQSDYNPVYMRSLAIYALNS